MGIDRLTALRRFRRTLRHMGCVDQPTALNSRFDFNTLTGRQIGTAVALAKGMKAQSINQPIPRIHPITSRAPSPSNPSNPSKAFASKASASKPPNSRCNKQDKRDSSHPPPITREDFETMIWPHRSELFAAALRYTKNTAAAEDLVQETLMRAVSAWAGFQPGTNCRAWLYRILTNSFINIHRKRKRFRRFAHDRGDDSVIAFYGVEKRRDPRPDERIIDNSLSDEVETAMSQLTTDYREVVKLADIEGIRYKDIAKRLNVPIGTVMSRLFRARRQLETALTDYASTTYSIRRAA